MPSGYTSEIYEGKDITFREYALNCARAFGAYITLRDSPNSELPTEFKPGTYYLDKLNEAAKKVQELIAMTQAQRNAAAVKQHEESMKNWKKSEQKNYERTRRYDLMLEQARKYVSPTPEHESFAKFLVDQLEESKKFDCHAPGAKYYTEPVAISGDEWYSHELERATKNVTYYSEEWKKELQRTNERNEWIKELFQSLPEK